MTHTDGQLLPAGLHDSVAYVRDNHTDGASRLARVVAQALADASTPGDDDAERLRQVREAARQFARSRPSMAAVANAAACIWRAAADSPSSAPGSRLEGIHEAAVSLLAASDSADQRIFQWCRPLFGGTLYTLSRSGTVEGALRRLGRERRKSGERPQVIVSESRPGGEGVTLARLLAEWGWSVMLVSDAACGLFIHDASAVVLGADSIRPDGSLVNKVGSYPLALMGREAGVPVYVLCERLKIAPSSFPLHFEEMNQTALLDVPVPGITARAVAFDHTPAELITSVVTEAGVLGRDGIARLAEDARAAFEALMEG